MSFSLISAVILSVLFLVSCAALLKEEKFNLLDNITDQYEKAIRWGEYNVALSFLKDSEAVTDIDSMKKFRITSYQVLQRKISEDGNEAEQHVEIRYYSVDYMVEHSIIDKQKWIYDSDSDMWYLETGLPAFR